MEFDASSWSIRRPVPTLVLFLVLTLAGILAFLRLGIDANPNIDLPIIVVETSYPGASPEELERQFTQKIEDAVAALGDVEEIYSGIQDGEAFTAIRFDLGSDSDALLDKVQATINGLSEDIAPYDEALIVRKENYDDGAVLTYAVRAKDTGSATDEAFAHSTAETLSDLVDRTIAPALMSVKGVAEVRRIGGVDREIRVDLDPDQLAAYGISAAQVNEQVSGFNRNLPGGRAAIAGQEQSIRALGKVPGAAASLEALRNLAITLPSGEQVPLSALANVVDDFAEVRQVATLNGQPVVSFGVFRSNGSLLVSVEEGVKAALAQLQPSLPENVELELIYTRASDVRESYEASIEALWLGSLLAVIVVGGFLRNWRTTLITATALPLSIIPTFIVLKGLGYSLNSMTLLALTLAVGNLVDDAIVEIENIERHLDMGKPPRQAAIDSAAEVGLAVITTTATIVAVFIPVAFMGGIPGQFFQPFGVTVAVATMFSTLVARLITPLMATHLLLPRNLQQGGPQGGQLAAAAPERLRPYHWLLGAALRHRLVTLAIALGIFAAGLSLVPHIPTGLISAGNTDLSHLSIEFPPGTSLATARSHSDQLSAQLRRHPAVESVYTSQDPNQAEAVIRLLPQGQREISRQAFEQQVRQQLQSLPDLRFNFDSQGPGNSDKALNIVLKSANPQLLSQTANQLAQEMKQVPGLVEVGTSMGLVKPELFIRPHPQRAAELGVNLQAIATTAKLATLGDSESALAEIDAGDRQIPIRVRLAAAYRSNIESLANLPIANDQQQFVPLSAVADIAMGGGPAEIQRIDRARQIEVSANLENISLGDALAKVYELPTLKNLPAEVTEQTAGDADILEDVFSRFTLALGTAVVAIYAVLVLLYNSFIYPLAVMSALPLSIGGTFVALLLTHKALDLYALIGIVLLMGLVTKNSILLVDYALQARQRGLSLKQAVIESGVTRLRPILMTSISTIAGMVPIALEMGAGGEVRSPMAIAVIGGFTTATTLTLIVVPVCFTYIAGLQQRFQSIAHSIGRWFNRGSVGRQNRAFAYAPAASVNPHSPSNHSSERSVVTSPQKPVGASPPLSKMSNSPTQSSFYAITSSKEQPETSIEVSNRADEKAQMPAGASPYSSDTNNGFSQEAIAYDKGHPHPSGALATVDYVETYAEAADDTVPAAQGVPLYNIACVEQDLATLCSLHDYLDNTVFSLVPVEDAMVALTDLIHYQPDVIFLTLSMPELDGFKVCKSLRKSRAFRTVPIILLADRPSWLIQLKAKWHGASACFTKPLDRTQLLVKLFLLLI